MEAIDCATSLTPAAATALKSSSIIAVGRYLGGNYALTPTELSAIHNAGLSVILIYESTPTKASYFSYGQGVADAGIAISEAIFLGAPNNTAIYFAVDYDAQGGDLGAIVDYFQGAKDGLGGKYALGAYGSYAVMRALTVGKYWQTYAWSNGQVFPGNHIYQYQNDTTLQGISVDRDTILNNAGCWPGIGGNKVFANLVIYDEKVDNRAAAYLADAFKAPMVSTDNVTPELLACATKKYKVGGDAYAGATLVSGNNRFSTMAAVLKLVGEI